MYYYEVESKGERTLFSELAPLGSSYLDLFPEAFAVGLPLVLPFSAKPSAARIWSSKNRPLPLTYTPCINFKEGTDVLKIMPFDEACSLAKLFGDDKTFQWGDVTLSKDTVPDLNLLLDFRVNPLKVCVDTSVRRPKNIPLKLPTLGDDKVKNRALALTKYREVASRFEFDDVQYFLDVTSKIRESNEDDQGLDKPFGAIVAPSGSGKTMLVEVLKQLGIRCVKLVLGDAGLEESPQPINLSTYSLSRIFVEAVRKDIDKLRAEGVSDNQLNSCNLYYAILDVNDSEIPVKDIPLATLGLLHNIMMLEDLSQLDGQILSDDLRIVTEMTFAVCRSKVPSNAPIFFLDEFNLSNRSNPVEMVFARNILRALGLVCITMGTDSTSTNLFRQTSTGSNFSRDGKTTNDIVWVYVITHLPHPSTRSLGIDSLAEDFPLIQEGPYKELIEWIKSVPCCNPWFMEVTLEYIRKNLADAVSRGEPIGQFMDKMLKSVSTTIYDEKIRRSARRDVIVGSVLTNFERWRKDASIWPVYLINGYFTEFSPPNGSESPFYFELHRRILVRKFFKPNATSEPKESREMVLLSKSDTKWTPHSRLPSFDSNKLFYAILHYLPLSSLGATVKEAFDTCMSKGSNFPPLENLLALSNCGSSLEIVAHLAVLYASRINGLDKLTFFEYLLTLSHNFSLKENLISVFDIQCDLAKMVPEDYFDIPYIGSTKSFEEEPIAIPQHLVPDRQLAVLNQCRNAEQIDGAVITSLIRILIECKNYTDEVRPAILRQAIINMLKYLSTNEGPQKAVLHFFCPKVASGVNDIFDYLFPLGKKLRELQSLLLELKDNDSAMVTDELLKYLANLIDHEKSCSMNDYKELVELFKPKSPETKRAAPGQKAVEAKKKALVDEIKEFLVTLKVPFEVKNGLIKGESNAKKIQEQRLLYDAFDRLYVFKARRKDSSNSVSYDCLNREDRKTKQLPDNAVVVLVYPLNDVHPEFTTTYNEMSRADEIVLKEAREDLAKEQILEAEALREMATYLEGDILEEEHAPPAKEQRT